MTIAIWLIVGLLAIGVLTLYLAIIPQLGLILFQMKETNRRLESMYSELEATGKIIGGLHGMAVRSNFGV